MGTRLFVGNLSFETTEASLKAAFTGGGHQITSASVVMDRATGRSRGFAFVDLATAEAASAAIASMNGKSLDGRALRVSEAEERRPSGPSRPREGRGY